MVTLPNRVYITGARTEFVWMRVIYNYQPYDDPDERAKWQWFMRNPKDPVAIQWYCDNVAAKMDKSNRDTWSNIIGCAR